MKDDSINSAYSEIKKTLSGLYGIQAGSLRFEYLIHSSEKYLKTQTDKQILINKTFNRDNPYKSLKGKIFAIAYPDNIYTDDEYTLNTLHKTLKKYFPAVKGIHILPERTMSHGDVWPQDFFSLFTVEVSQKVVASLSESGILDSNRYITHLYEK